MKPVNVRASAAAASSNAWVINDDRHGSLQRVVRSCGLRIARCIDSRNLAMVSSNFTTTAQHLADDKPSLVLGVFPSAPTCDWLKA